MICCAYMQVIDHGKLTCLETFHYKSAGVRTPFPKASQLPYSHTAKLSEEMLVQWS